MVIYVKFLSPDSDPNPQTLLFSATCPPWVYEVAKKYMKPECKHVDLIGKKTQKAATTVEVSAFLCEGEGESIGRGARCEGFLTNVTAVLVL